MEDELDEEMSFEDVCEALSTFGEGATNQLLLELIQELSEQLDGLRMEIMYLRQSQQQAYPIIKTAPHSQPYYQPSTGSGGWSSTVTKHDPTQYTVNMVDGGAEYTLDPVTKTFPVWIADAVKKHIPAEEEL